jgi:hypothetical protein
MGLLESQVYKEGMWAINKEFLARQVAAGKQFVFTDLPTAADIARNSYGAREFAYLQSLGYKFNKNITNGLFYAAK